MERKNQNLRNDSRGISPIVATTVLVIATLVIGGVAFVAFRNQTTSMTHNASVQVKNINLVKGGSVTVASFTVKNTGTVHVDNVTAMVRIDDDSTPALENLAPIVSKLAPGQSKGDSVSGNVSDNNITPEIGKSYVVKIVANTADGGTISRTITVMCSG